RKLKTTCVGAVGLGPVIVRKCEIGSRCQRNWGSGRRRVCRCVGLPGRRIDRKTGVVKRPVEAVEIRPIEQIERFPEHLYNQPFTESDVTGDAEIDTVIPVSVIAVARDIRRQRKSAHSERSATELSVGRSVQKERYGRKRDRRCKWPARLRGVDT